MIYFLFLSRYMSSVLMYLQIVRIYSSLLISAFPRGSGTLGRSVVVHAFLQIHTVPTD
jgi:hypothetical protein